MRFNKKGQAAMEFLMTYGWAILIAIIAIAALIAFGVLNPGKSSANTCGTANALMPNLGCTELKVAGAQTSTNAVLTLILTNGLGKDIGSASMSAVTGCTAGVFTTNPATIVDSGTATYVSAADCTCTNGRFKGSVSYTYTLAGDTLSHTLTGVPVNARCES